MDGWVILQTSNNKKDIVLEQEDCLVLVQRNALFGLAVRQLMTRKTDCDCVSQQV